MEQLPGYHSQEEDKDITHYTIDWRYFNGSLSDTVATWFYNTDDQYYVELDSSWKGNFTVMYDASRDADVFYHWKGDAVGVELVAIKTYSKEAFAQGAEEGYTKLFENDTTVWAASVMTEHKELPITIEKLKEKFHIILE